VADSRVSAPQPTFACLWCGASWTVRAPDDLEGYARLCPDCLGKAGDNEFLRFRLRAALEARATAAVPAREATEGATVLVEVAPRPTDTDPVAYDEARTREDDDWYLRRGRYAHGPPPRRRSSAPASDLSPTGCGPTSMSVMRGPSQSLRRLMHSSPASG